MTKLRTFYEAKTALRALVLTKGIPWKTRKQIQDLDKKNHLTRGERQEIAELLDTYRET